MAKVILNNRVISQNNFNYEDLVLNVTKLTNLTPSDFYFEQNGKRLSCDNAKLDWNSNVYCWLRVYGGKGGFGSMLRAIGAQIEKTTNREACRDLSGRRLRDINEEKRLKAWLEKQGEREREAEERKKRKVEKLLTVPKHEFKDEQYEEARSRLTEKVNDAVEEGFKKAHENKKFEEKASSSAAAKRKSQIATKAIKSKKKKSALWIGDDISDSDEDKVSEKSVEKSSDNDDEHIKKTFEKKIKESKTLKAEKKNRY